MTRGDLSRILKQRQGEVDSDTKLLLHAIHKTAALRVYYKDDSLVLL